jgi:hypothetical protein
MKKNFGIILAIALGLSALLLLIAFQAGWVQAMPFKQERAGAPTIVSYQGQIWDGDAPYNGTGYFKFAILDATGTTYYWSNDTGELGIPPEEYIILPVVNGLFSVNLGDSSLFGGSMTALSADVFDDPHTVLRVWFSPDGVEFTQMPDQVIAAVPYALQAQEAVNADLAAHATSADSATNATNATHATSADSATNATNATHATSADSATNATNATHANSADSATNASNSDTLDTYHAASFQLRVTGTCPVGTAVNAIGSDGTVGCEEIPSSPKFTLSTLDLYKISGTYTSIAIGSDGLGLISYFSDDNYLLKVAHCDNTACTSATSDYIDSTYPGGRSTSIAIGVDGLGLISYYGGQNNDLTVAHCNDVNCSSAEITHLDTTGTIGLETSLAIGSDGLGLIVYLDYTSDTMKVAHCLNLSCSLAEFTTLVTGAHVSGYPYSKPSVTVGSDGLPLLSFTDQTTRNLILVHCDNLSCSDNSISTLGSTAGAGIYSSIAIGPDGLGLIAFSDFIDGDLNVAHCSNLICSSANVYTLDSTGNVGEYISLAIGIDGLGMISYYDVTNGDLKVAHCNYFQCNSATISTLDTSGDKGKYTSIAIGLDGFGLISYFDATEGQGDLEVAHCNNIQCLPINWEP